MSLRTKSFVISLENYCEETRRAIRLGRCIFARVSHVLERERERGRSFKMKKRFRFYVEKGESNDGRERKEKKNPLRPTEKRRKRFRENLWVWPARCIEHIGKPKVLCERGDGGLDFTRPSDFRASRVWLAHANPENISFLAGFAPRPHSSTGLALFPSAKHFLILRWHLYLQ